MSTSKKISTGPLPSSRKIYLAGEQFPDLQIPMREIQLTDASIATVYDTSGPYSEADADIDIMVRTQTRTHSLARTTR